MDFLQTVTYGENGEKVVMSGKQCEMETWLL